MPNDASIRVRLPGELYAVAKIAADLEHKKLSAWVRDAVREKVMADES